MRGRDTRESAFPDAEKKRGRVVWTSNHRELDDSHDTRTSKVSHAHATVSAFDSHLMKSSRINAVQAGKRMLEMAVLNI